MKDKNLRKLLWGHWHSQNKETGGPFLELDYGKWEIPVSDGVVRFLLKRIDELESRINKLEPKSSNSRTLKVR